MARFWRVEAAIYGHLQDSKTKPRWLNVYHIDEVEPLPDYNPQDENGDPLKDQEGNLVYRPMCALVMHHEPGQGGRKSYLQLLGISAADAVAHIEKMLLDDRMLVVAPHEHEDAPAPPVPAQLGYAYASKNTAVVSASVEDIDGYETIEFTGRAAETVAKALAVTEPFIVRVPRADIPVNDNPVSAPHKVLTAPDGGNINVSRSTDGTTLYFLADDAVMAFGIEVIGHPAAESADEA